MKEINFNIRYIDVNKVKYLRAEDVANYIRAFAATQETDIRNSLNEMSINIEKAFKP